MTSGFSRDSFTWLNYLTLGYFAYLLNAIGPAMPFLRAELDLSYTLSSAHLSAFAVGILLAGLGSDRLIARFGRRAVFRLGVVGMALSTLLLLVSHHPALTIGSALLMGSLGSLVLVIIPAALSDHHGNDRVVAITEANIIASLCSVCAPVLLGLFVRIGVGWRGVFVVPVLVALLLNLLFWRVPFADPPAPRQSGLASARLPGLYWLYWTVLVLAISVEFCIIFWGATFLETQRDFVRADAASAMSLFLGAMLLGRLIGSRLTQWLRSEWVILGSIGLCLASFLMHWTAEWSLLTMTGLFLAGLGVANLYPQILSLAVGAALNQTDIASARASLASGLAILALPLLLGGLADQFGLRYAYGLVIILLLFAGLGMLLARQQSTPVRPVAGPPRL
ncbi:MAG: MFS transporter [Anaerolineales bacterium]|nr:MFS transporter [Anaerolineales bacterium]